MGIIFTTRGWTGAAFEVYDGTNPSEVYTVTSDTSNAYDVVTALAAWIEDPARAWFGALTSLEWGAEWYAGDPRVAFWFTASGVPLEIYTNGQINITTVRGTSMASGITRGSCAAIPGMVMTDRRSSESGSRSRNTSWRMGHGLYAHRTPNVELALSLGETYAFCEAIRIAASPRTAYLYDEQSDSWSLWTIGRHSLGSHTDSDTTKTAGTLEVIGGA